MKLLNLGCGYRFHKDWVNVDFVAVGEGVIAHNLLKGIPFSDNQFDVVYHSHVLEHFNKEDAVSFVKECFRVLKPGGIIRVAIPDLEQIAREYIQNLEGALKGDKISEYNYDWIMVEMYDQAIRTQSGGAYGEFFSKEKIPNEEYLIKRMGYEYLNARRTILLEHQRKSVSQKKIASDPLSDQVQAGARYTKKKNLIRRLIDCSTYINKLKRTFFKQEYIQIDTMKEQLKQQYKEEKDYAQLGRFRASGEIHQWMYDRFSLARLLKSVGFIDVITSSAYESSIPEWSEYELDIEKGTVRKPDSLFMEATKPL